MVTRAGRVGSDDRGAMSSIPASRDVVTVRSPEGVELELPIAGPASRIAAYCIDLVGLGVLSFFVLVVAIMGMALHEGLHDTFKAAFEPAGSGATPAEQARIAVAALVVGLVLLSFSELIYFCFFELVSGGRSPGKYLMRLRVVGAEGQPVRPRAILIRNVLRAVDTLPAGYAFGLIAMIVSGRRQRLGDHAAGTLVIRADRVERPAAFALPLDLQPLALSREQLARLGERELSLLRTTLRRLKPGSDPASHALATQVAEALTQRLKLEATTDDPVRLLQELLITAAPHELKRAQEAS